MSFVELTKNATIAAITLNRPERLNAISTTMTDDLHEALLEANNDPDVRVIVFSGKGRAFCAGDDLKEFEQQTASDAATIRHINGIQQITRDLMFSDKIVVGAIHGYAVGGGFEWMLNCDLIVAANGLVAFFPEMEWGQFVTGGVTHLLPQAIGHQQAMELLVLGERQSAEMLKARGIVNWIAKEDETLSKAYTVAEAVASKSPFSVAALKRLLTREISPNLSRSLELETEITVATFKSDEARKRSEKFPTQRRNDGSGQ